MKKMLTLMFMLLLLTLCLPIGASAEEVTGTCGTNLSWTFDRNSGVLTISGTGAMQDNPYWNGVSGDVKTIRIGEGVTTIGQQAFQEFYALTDIELPSRMERIGARAFHSCTSLKAIRLPEGITELPEYVFWHAQDMKQVTLPESLTRIGPSAFTGCTALKSLTAPAGVREIGSKAFQGTSVLTVTFVGDAPSFDPDAFDNGVNITLVYPAAANGWSALTSQRFSANSLNWMSDGAPTEAPPPADSPRDPSLALEPAISNNNGAQNIFGNYGHTITSHLVDNGDGTYTRIEYTNNKIHVEVYDGSYNLIWKQQLERELPMWGGFYSGKNYNFLVFGQRNPNEDDNCEVVRVVRYSKNWHRIDSASVYGCNTTVPFDAGSLRMVEWGDYLHIHTCHERYTSYDGLRHQSSMNLQLLIPEMKLIGGDGGCSHSFNQFIIEDEGVVVRLNHGDASPRYVVINGATMVLRIPGEKGDNYTGTTVGAFLASEKNYLTAGTTLIDWQADKFGKVRNLFLGVTNKETRKTTLRKITDYGENRGVSTPHMVKAGEDRFLLLWTEYYGELSQNGDQPQHLRYVFLDGEGASVSQIYESPYPLSSCVPILTGNRVLWYVTTNTQPVFYWIDLDRPETVHTSGQEALPATQTQPAQTPTTQTQPAQAGDPSLICSEWARANVTGAWELIKGRIPYSFNWGGNNIHGEATSIITKDLTQPITRAEFATLVSAAYDYILGDTAVNDGYNTTEERTNTVRELLMPTDGQMSFSDTWFDPASGKTLGWTKENDPDRYRRIMSNYLPNTGWKAHEYIDGIMAACNMGLMSGYSETDFGPNDSLNREQAATVLLRMSERYSDFSYRKDPSQSAAFPAWTAANPYTDTISNWALDGVLRARAAGIMMGAGDTTTFSSQGSFTREQALVTLGRIIEWCKPWYQELTAEQLADNAVRRAANPYMF